MDTPGPGRTPVLETREFASLADYSKATGQDRHSMLVDYDVFVNVRRLDAQDVTSLQKLYRAEDFDFRLQSGSAAVDAGVVLPTVRMALADVRRTVGQAIDDRRGPRRQPALVRRPARSGIVSRARRSGGGRASLFVRRSRTNLARMTYERDAPESGQDDTRESCPNGGRQIPPFRTNHPGSITAAEALSGRTVACNATLSV